MMEKRNKRGRPTIADNFLVGWRNDWVRLLEENWAEIGWPLICIRNERSKSLDDIQRALACLRDKPNGGLAGRLYRSPRQPGSTAEIRGSWKSISKLDARILKTEADRDAQERLLREAESALKQTEHLLNGSDVKVKETVILQITKRRDSLTRTTENLQQLNKERDALNTKVLDQESYLFCSELLDYLLQSGRYAVKPRPLANALAGLPKMRWRQSHSRCAKMPLDSETHLYYRTWDTIRRICTRNHAHRVEVFVEFFRISILRLPTKIYMRQFLCKHWRDLRLAIEECWNVQDPDELISFKVAARFVQNLTQQKNAVESVLAAQEELT
jgi:hypothetical protein